MKDRIWLAAGAVIALGAIAMPVLNPDLFWHLSAGKYIAQHLRLPAADFLSWTEAGAPWTDFEWLTQLLYYGVHSLAGKTGFFLLKLALLGATLPVFYSLLKLHGLGRAAFFGLPLWGLALMANSDLRPENFSVLFFALLLLRLERARLGGGWRVSPGTLAALAAFFALWANLHAGFAYGLLLLAFYCAGNFAERKLWPAAPDLPGAVSPALIAAAAAGTLLNPWGLKLYSILLAHAADAAALSRYLAEWAPPSLANPWHWPFMAYLLGAFGLLLLRFFRERALPPAHLLALGVFAFEASRHGRHMVFFGMTAAVVCAASAARLWPAELLLRRGRLLLGLAVVYLALLVWPRYAAFKVGPGEEAAGAAAWLKANAAQLAGRKLYNPWTWGGYLGWALNPDYKVFTDGRYLFHKYLVPVSEAMRDQDTWGEFAAEKGFELVLFRRDYSLLPFPIPGGKGIMRPSYLIFMPEKKWALVYWDRFSVLFARRSAALPAEYRLLRPDDLEHARAELCAGKASPADAAAELDRQAAAAPPSRETLGFRTWLADFPAPCAR